MVDATQVPYLPPAPKPEPPPTAPPVFDAKAMVDATKRNKVENPAYGHLPTGTPEGRAAADALRAKMRQKRRRNKMIGRVIAIVSIVVVVGGGYALYKMYQADQKTEQQQQAQREAERAAKRAESVGALTPLGQQEQVLSAMDDVNSGGTPSAGALVGAADAARTAV